MYQFTPDEIDRLRAHHRAVKRDAGDVDAKRIGNLGEIAFEQFCREYLPAEMWEWENETTIRRRNPESFAGHDFEISGYDVDVGELVLGPEELEFVVRRQEWPRIPQPDVVDGPRIVVYLPSGERIGDGELLLLDTIERVGAVGELDLVFEILRFFVERVGSTTNS